MTEVRVHLKLLRREVLPQVKLLSSRSSLIDAAELLFLRQLSSCVLRAHGLVEALKLHLVLIRRLNHIYGCLLKPESLFRTFVTLRR